MPYIIPAELSIFITFFLLISYLRLVEKDSAKLSEEVFGMLDSVKKWISENPLMAAGVMVGAGAAVTFLILKLMGKIKK